MLQASCRATWGLPAEHKQPEPLMPSDWGSPDKPRTQAQYPTACTPPGTHTHPQAHTPSCSQVSALTLCSPSAGCTLRHRSSPAPGAPRSPPQPTRAPQRSCNVRTPASAPLHGQACGCLQTETRPRLTEEGVCSVPCLGEPCSHAAGSLPFSLGRST